MPKVLPEYLEQRRQQIVDAAAACFSRRGFHQTTMQDICDEAGLSPGAVYRYFHGKEEIIQTMCDRSRNEDAAAIRAKLEGSDTLSIFAELADAFLVRMEDRENCALIIELTSEAGRNPLILESILKSRQAIMEPLIELVRRAQDRGEFATALDAEAVARVMMALYPGLLLQKLIEPQVDCQRYAEVVQSLFDGSFWQGGAPSARGAGVTTATTA